MELGGQARHQRCRISVCIRGPHHILPFVKIGLGVTINIQRKKTHTLTVQGGVHTPTFEAVTGKGTGLPDTLEAPHLLS